MFGHKGLFFITRYIFGFVSLILFIVFNLLPFFAPPDEFLLDWTIVPEMSFLLTVSALYIFPILFNPAALLLFVSGLVSLFLSPPPFHSQSDVLDLSGV